MDKKTGILGYLSQVFMIYGITVLLLNIFCLIFGEDAQTVSTIFSLGSNGVAVSTMLQFLLAISLIVILRFIIMTDAIIKKMSITARIVTMFGGVLIIMVSFIFAFGWFDVNEALAWVMFGVCFILSCAISTFISVLAEKQENKKLEEALRRLKEEQ